MTGQAVLHPWRDIESAASVTARCNFPGREDVPLPVRDTALEVLRRVYELGINHFDTAHFYRAGLANALLRAALEPYPDDVVVVTKVGAEVADVAVIVGTGDGDDPRPDLPCDLF